MKAWNKFLDEKEGQQHDFSSTQINLPKSLANEIIEWGREHIPDSFLYETEGREDEIHVTVLYGLRDEEPDNVKEILEKEKQIKFKLGKISLFNTNEEYDVVKIEVESPGLHKLHRLLQALPHMDSHPKYNPHVTIAYVKKGKAKRIVGEPHFEGEIITGKEIIFSSFNGEKTKIQLCQKLQKV